MVKVFSGKHLARQTGFSIVEVVVAMSILTIGILAVVPMLAFNIKANSSGKNYGYADYLAHERLEQIRSWPAYSDISATSPGVTMNNGLLFGTDYVPNETGAIIFTRTASVLRNGFEAFGAFTDCDGIKWATTLTFNEGTLLNTGTSVGERCSSTSTFRGEDFKIVRVAVDWNDQFGAHEIVRHMYVAQF